MVILKNVGLGEGSALPVGVPIPWPSATPPTGWLKCNGAPLSASQYPRLALVYPALKLPDLRGEFIRGWDDGRGADNGRGLLSAQSHALEFHNHYLPTSTGQGNLIWTIPDSSLQPSIPNEFPSDNSNMPALTYSNASNKMGTVGNQANETRPRNIAFNYIVRAA